MITDEKLSGECVYSQTAIHEHLQKLISNPLFSFSDILKRFLGFIVQETLEGRSDQLKEYTIGVKVLHKPVTFNPQIDAIVRIHACRLRRALNRYYETAGKSDGLRISVPKGNYIPFFYESLPDTSGQEIKSRDWDEHKKINKPAHIVAAVMPFSCFIKQDIVCSMAQGLASQLSSELSHLSNFSVITCNPLRFLDDRPVYLRELILKAGAQYLFTGDLQCQDNLVRINIQMINALTFGQIWSQQFERVLTESNLFVLQDEIVSRVIDQIEQTRRSKKSSLVPSPAMAVA